MEFEELQTIWESQNDENLYRINKEALYAQIKQKSQTVSHKLNLLELGMFVGNLIVGLILLADVLKEDSQTYEYALPAMYLAFSVFALVRRLSRRKKEEVRFEQTVLGEIDKAIWQVNYLIQQGRSMMVWYILPLIFVLSITLFLNGKPLFALPFIFILIPASYFGGRWEINKWYMPKKRDLESLRERLINESSANE